MQSRGFENEPQRCKACRDARKNAGRGTREMFTAVCASCGKEARAPSSPAKTVPVYLQRLLCEDEGRRLIFASKSPAVRRGFTALVNYTIKCNTLGGTKRSPYRTLVE